jgi:hypothetical protein
MSRQYLRRITRGLGASRHNANALTWNGSYASWLFYSAAFSIGFAVFGFLQLFRGAFDSGIDLKLSLSPAVGWLSAMWEMLQMNPSERRQLIGCAANRPR